LRPERIPSPLVLSLLLRAPFFSQIPLEREIRKASLKRIDRCVIAGFKYQTATVFVEHYGGAFL
jgi:hypothetical protein